MSTTAITEAQFDVYSTEYEAALGEGLRYSGEGPEYFAQKRIEWTAKLLQQLGDQSMSDPQRGTPPANLLDFGCGIGIAAPELHRVFPGTTLWGYDPSTVAIKRAVRELADEQTRFTADPSQLPSENFDLVYTNGVFHHIPPSERQAAFQLIWQSLKPGGRFAFWENNPWNPGTRWVMSRVPFDRDAVTISPPESRRLLRGSGFKIERTDAWFLFPRSLAWLRPLERLVHRLPLGGQYLVMARKPEASA
ncbi:trans-aconitate 2-methyltransferase [Adhaeretor mobilis]|uniref:Trans-aconitate 2-methyltransferase n=2 Tax=Adhaeretor mobilis TaxID=1930276 RepID=A0A517MSQ3_9BACT|nr:trans-aconitate 2-methyltransferase [Adhaeretor mobilis]